MALILLAYGAWKALADSEKSVSEHIYYDKARLRVLLRKLPRSVARAVVRDNILTCQCLSAFTMTRHDRECV